MTVSRQDETLNEICARGDWRRVRDLYTQFSAIASDAAHSGVPSDDILSGLTEALARVFPAYESMESEFVTDLMALLGDIDQLPSDPIERFRRLYKDTRLNRLSTYGDNSHSRSRPKPFETAFETVRRIEDLNRVRLALEMIPSSAILGGSMSYGRFYNVCGGAGKPSDTDLLLVVPSYESLPAIAEALRGLDFISESSHGALVARIDEFTSIRDRYAPCIFQHKLHLWEQPHVSYQQFQIPGYYLLALHVLSIDDFQFVTLHDTPILKARLSRSIREYRDDRPPKPETELHCFAGYARSVKRHPVKTLGGWVTTELVADIRNERFYPGVHLNLLLPQFEVRWEAPEARIRLTLLNLRWKLLARLADEQQMRSFEIQRLSLSHTRSGTFAPHVVRRVDRA